MKRPSVSLLPTLRVCLLLLLWPAMGLAVTAASEQSLSVASSVDTPLQMTATGGAALTTSTSSSSSSSSRCEPTVTPFDMLKHKKKVYTVGVLAIRGDETAYREFNQTFGDYLTATAGKRFDPPIQFQMKPLNFVTLFTQVEAKNVDFIYVNPSAFSCIESEFGAQSLVSQISRRVVGGNSYDLTQFGGVIATLRNNSEVNTIHDLKDKIIAAASISGLGSGQMQFKQMLDSGMSFINDPKQLVFTSNQGKVVKGLLNGEFDVAFVRTDQLERSKDSNGNPIIDTASVFKIIDPKPNLLEIDGVPFPFQSSTPLYPEWNLAALDVPDDISLSVQEGMASLSAHARTGKGLQQCEQQYNTTFCDTLPFPDSLDLNARCDTTKEIAKIANSAMALGKYAGFRTTLSYMQLRSMQQATGFISLDPITQQWTCVKSKEIYQSIFCPEGYFRKSKKEVDSGCSLAGLECKEGFQCLCSPCLKGFDVDVRPMMTSEQQQEEEKAESSSTTTNSCPKMSLCGTTQQRQPLQFQAVDNLKRVNSTMTVILHDGQETRSIVVSNNQEEDPFLYLFAISSKLEGVLTMELFIDGEQIPTSPLRVTVESRDCDEYGSNLEADSYGHCVCEKGFLQVGDNSCIEYWLLLPLIFGLTIALAVVVGYFYVERKKREADSVWSVKYEDLKYPSPRVCLGEGAFGLVELASLHGTNVAVKMVLPNPESERSRVANVCEEEEEDSDGGGNFVRSTHLTKSAQYESRSRSWTKVIGLLSNYKRGTAQMGKSTRSPSQAQLRSDFKREMRLLSKLRHPCITTVMGAVIEPRMEPLLILEHCEMGSLYEIVHNETMHLQGELLLPIMRDIVTGIRFLHASQIIHGDIKSRNILITRGYNAKVADFGLSQKKKSSGARGTPFFMAPELLLGESDNSAASDIYSLGIVFWELIARKDPYYNYEFGSRVFQDICDPLINLRPETPAHCPKEVTKLMESCWDRDPPARPTAEDLDERLKLFHVGNVEPTNSQSKAVQPSGDSFLYQVFPKHIADKLIRGEKVEPQSHSCVTIFFSDIVNFTTISSLLPPMKVSNMLDRLYLAFDSLCRKYQIFKVETVGDAFMAVSNLIEDQCNDHVKRVADFSREAIHVASKICVDLEDPAKGYIKIRVGFHSGPVVSNVVGSLNPRFGLFGDTVNVASRMESNSKPGRIHCSADAANLLQEQCPKIKLKDRGYRNVKGKGRMKTYWVMDDYWQPEDDCNSSHASLMLDFPEDDEPISPQLGPDEVPSRDRMVFIDV